MVERVAASDVAPAMARALVRRMLERWGLSELTWEAELVTSELVSNAVMHAPVPTVYELELWRLEHGVHLALTDGSSVVPAIRDLGAGEPGGRSLRIIEAVASAWGHEERPGGGKTVWVELLT